ncbi:MAG: hypothetical protein ABJN42_13615 [Roseibium sp.]|uniref:hypothetical protein n=1 Tax=Roseibium sp. TaxID=1936156 RepID=UPI00329A03BF
MSEKSRYYVLKIMLVSEEFADEQADQIKEDFVKAGVDVEVYDNLDRMIVVVPDNVPVAKTNEIFDGMGFSDPEDFSDRWTCGPANGKKLSVNLLYHDEEQVVSATVDEGLLASALAGVDPYDSHRRLCAAITALAGDNEFTFGYGPLNGDMAVQDIMEEVRFWDPDRAALWAPESWDPDEPMLTICFQPQAAMASGDGIVDVIIEGMETDWEMPLRLMPDGINPDDPATLTRLVELPCAPEAARKWVEMMPFEIEIDNPEIIPAYAPSQDLEM